MASERATEIAKSLPIGDETYFSYSYINDTTGINPKLIGAITIPTVLMLVLIVGLVGNFTVVYVILKAGHGRVKSATNSYIINLAITDISFLLCCVPSTASMHVWEDWMFGKFMCKLMFYMMHVSRKQ